MSAITLVASRTDISSPTPIVLTNNLSSLMAAVFLLNVTAAATAAGDTFDLYIQDALDDGATIFDDFIHFTQVLGNGGAKKYVAEWSGFGAVASSPQRAVADASMAAGVINGPKGAIWRVKPIIVSASSPSFTWSLVVRPLNWSLR